VSQLSSVVEDAPAVSDVARETLVARLASELGDGVCDTLLKPGDDLWIRVRLENWVQAVTVARDELAMDYFCFLSGLDWMPSPWGRGEDDPTEPPPVRSTEIKQGYAGGETRFQVFARLYSIRDRVGFTLKADVAPDTDGVLAVPTLVGLYAGANWHERECWEMFGFTFTGHPNLTHLYLPGGFEGHPLRKDFPLLARMVKPWPGIVDVEPMPGGDDAPADDASGDEAASDEAAP
jgi:NADH-quinone oxidoreductase subunit C